MNKSVRFIEWLRSRVPERLIPKPCVLYWVEERKVGIPEDTQHRWYVVAGLVETNHDKIVDVTPSREYPQLRKCVGWSWMAFLVYCKAKNYAIVRNGKEVV